ncbi:MAG: YceI family protein [Myxococcales bacterium]|nr:YceI family protein [Myxococcales bacterium]
MSLSTWNIDASHSGVHFTVRHMVFAKVRGRFTRFGGAILGADGDLSAASVAVEIEADSIDTGVVDRDNHLKSPDFFDVAAFPKLSFQSTKVETLGDEKFRLHGQLTIRGTTRDVVLDGESGGVGKDPWGNQRIGFTAKTSVNRTDFGLKWNQMLEAGGVLVGEKVEIELEVQAVKAA